MQLDHLVSVSYLPNARIGVLPLSAEVPDGAYHTFVIYDRKLVTADLFTGQLVLRDPKDIDHYRALFDFFAERALWANAARALLPEAAQGVSCRRPWSRRTARSAGSMSR